MPQAKCSQLSKDYLVSDLSHPPALVVLFQLLDPQAVGNKTKQEQLIKARLLSERLNCLWEGGVLYLHLIQIKKYSYLIRKVVVLNT